MGDCANEQYFIGIGEVAPEAKLNMGVDVAAVLGDVGDLLFLPISDEPLSRPTRSKGHAALRSDMEGLLVFPVRHRHVDTTDQLTATVGHLAQAAALPVEHLVLPGAATVAGVEPHICSQVAEGEGLGEGKTAECERKYHPVRTSESLDLNPSISWVMELPQGNLHFQQYFMYSLRQSLPAMGPAGIFTDSWRGVLLMMCMGTISESWLVPSLISNTSCLCRKTPQQPLEKRYQLFMILSLRYFKMVLKSNFLTLLI